MSEKKPSLKQTGHQQNTPDPSASSVQEDVEPGSFWDDMRDGLPPWLDEIIAIALLIFGILSFLALLFPSEAVVAVTWANIVTSLFGYGSLIISGGLFALGVVILLPKAGLRVSFPPVRVLALEAAFLCTLAVLHLAMSDSEMRALARAGQGGGIVGYGLSLPVSWVIGQIMALIVFVLLLLVSLLVLIGFSGSRLVQAVRQSGHKLQRMAERFVNDDKRLITELETVTATQSPQDVVRFYKHQMPLMHIRPDLDQLPPSLRNSLETMGTETGRDLELDADLSTHPLFNGTQLRRKGNDIIGEVLRKKGEDGHFIVRRPDGRLKRYFKVDEMKEAKKIGRRDQRLPPLELLADIPLSLPEEDEVNRNVVLIENTLLEFDIDIDVVDVQIGPTVTRYAVQPYRRDKDGVNSERTRLSKIASYTNDLALALSVKRLRLEIPVPGTSYMGIEVPNKNASTVALRSVFESKAFHEQLSKAKTPLVIPLGRDVAGQPKAIDIAAMPHLLIAGTTGSGKSVAIAAVAAALLLENTPDKIKMIMLDPKMVELSRFNGLPHLIGPVETDTDRIIGVLRWCTREMERRYKVLEENGVRNIDGYNARIGSRRGSEYMPYIVIMIDEIGDLMLSRPEETEKAITRLAQMARAVGMHLIVATQRPSVDVITGLIKANFPGRISFAVASGVDSRVILDSVGAENLLGKGDMLFLASDAAGPQRIQGCFVTDEEVRRIVQHWQTWHQQRIEEGKEQPIRVGPWERGLTRREFLAETDPMLEEVIELVVSSQEASASFIQRRLGLGYPRAARIMDLLEELGVVGETVGGGRARRVIIAPGEDPFKRVLDQYLNKKKRKASE